MLGTGTTMDYDTQQWLIFNFINGAGGKFLANCFFQFDQVANWYQDGLSKKQRAEKYIQLLDVPNDNWLFKEPDQPWGLTFFSRTYPRGRHMDIEEWNRCFENCSTEYFKNCWDNNKIIVDYYHQGIRPTFWSKARWITIQVDDVELYKSLLFTKVYNYNKHTKTMVNQMEDPNFGTTSNRFFKKKFQNAWHWENIHDIDQFMIEEIKTKPWHQSWQNIVYPNQDIINLSDLFDFEKLKQFLSKYQTVFNEQLDFENIKQMQESWVSQTESKSKNVF